MQMHLAWQALHQRGLEVTQCSVFPLPAAEGGGRRTAITEASCMGRILPPSCTQRFALPEMHVLCLGGINGLTLHAKSFLKSVYQKPPVPTTSCDIEHHSVGKNILLFVLNAFPHIFSGIHSSSYSFRKEQMISHCSYS